MLRPAAKNYIWGGDRLRKDYRKDIDVYPLAECWECSVHPDGVSIVVGGEFNGCRLDSLLCDHPEFLGTHPDGRMPVLVKLIDAAADLSVQVHPDDEYALKHEGQLGKTEMWYVLQADPGAKIAYGFSRDVSRDEVNEHIAAGSLDKILQYIPVKKDDVFYVPAGQVHAICAGVVVAEIQESSNVTYRLYDYNRLDKDGKPRQLHIAKALDVINRNGSACPRQPLRVLKFKKGCATEALARCRYFTVDRMLLNNTNDGNAVLVNSDSAFRVLMCVNGGGELIFDKETLKFGKGDTVFIPAGSGELQICGRAQLLIIGG